VSLHPIVVHFISKIILPELQLSQSKQTKKTGEKINILRLFSNGFTHTTLAAATLVRLHVCARSQSLMLHVF